MGGVRGEGKKHGIDGVHVGLNWIELRSGCGSLACHVLCYVACVTPAHIIVTVIVTRPVVRVNDTSGSDTMRKKCQSECETKKKHKRKKNESLIRYLRGHSRMLSILFAHRERKQKFPESGI